MPRTLPALVVLLASPLALAELPDLAVTDLTVDAQCQAVITVRNLGPGALPASAMYSGSDANLSFRKNDGGSGSWSMNKPALVPAGGTYVHTVQALNLQVEGEASYTAAIDSSNLITEASEANNALTRTLSCTPTKPDLTLASIEFDNECRARLTIRNVGKATLGNAQHGNTLVYREIDGASKGTIRLADMDPARQAAAPGGTATWTDWPEFKPVNEARYRLAIPSGSDANTDNNDSHVTVPDRCKTGGSKTLPMKPLMKPRLPAQVIPRP